MYIFPNEYSSFGLPNSSQQPDIDNLVQLCSIMIDEHCGRTDGDGNGSLVYTTYQERLVSQSIRRNIYLIPKRPLVALSVEDVATLQALDLTASGHYYTGVQPSINTLADGSLSAIIAASGRYTYGRRNNYAANDAFESFYAPLSLVTLAGGPSPWVALDMTNLDYDVQTGECWFAAGSSILGYNYNEIIVTYNSGYNPAIMPRQVKLACAAMVKRAMAGGSGTTGLKSLSVARSGMNIQFDPDYIDPNIARMLAAFVSVRAT